MAKLELGFIEMHNPMFMQGSNMGTRIKAKERGARLFLDTELSLVWVHFKGKVAFVPLANIATGDLMEQLDAPLTELPQPAHRAPAAIARAQAYQSEYQEPSYPDHDPEDLEAAAAHRARVRAASMNSNRPQASVQNDMLIQQSRMAAMGMKQHAVNPQVSNPTQPAMGQTGIPTPNVQAAPKLRGRPKAISHAGAVAQMKAELAKPNPNDV